jgi:hypothetical protein
MVSPTSLKGKENILANIRRDSESVNEYEADEFEKEDLVQMGEPKRVVRPAQGGRNPQMIAEKHTNDTSSHDNNSLMREISIRNNKQANQDSQAGVNMPHLKQMNRPRNIRDSSKEGLVISAREHPHKESLQSNSSQ